MRVLFVIFFLMCFASAQEYSADVTINVLRDGYVEVSGESNHPILKEGVYGDLTVKKDGFWLLNITSKERFSNYKYSISLPKDSKINYLGVYSISEFEDDDGFKISGNVKNKPFTVVIQYKTGYLVDDFLFTAISFVSLVVIGISIYLFFRRRKHKRKYSFNEFSEREYLIIKLLEVNGGCLTQTELEAKTGLPKASLFRNLSSLEGKKIIEKHKSGMTNKIKLI